MAFYAQQSPEFMVQLRQKHPMSSCFVDGNALLMEAINREWLDWFDLTEPCWAIVVSKKACQKAQQLKLL